MGRGRQMSTWANNFGPYPLIFMLLILRPNAVRKVGAASVSLSNSSLEITCPGDQYLHDAKGICCNKCTRGYKLVKECEGPNQRTECAPCEGNYFLDSENYFKSCFRCRKCKDNEEELRKCTSKENTVCQCKKGYYKYILVKGEHECRSCKKCGTGERETQQCGPETNRQCDCKDFHYRVHPSACKLCEECSKECKHKCPTTSTPAVKQPDPAGPLFVAVPVTILLTSLLMSLVWLSRKVIKSRWAQKKKSPTSTSEPPDPSYVSVTSSESLITVESTMKREYSENVPFANYSHNETQSALPDCVPQEIKTIKFIYSVLEVVPVPRIMELVRLLGVKDQDIERARRDHPISCCEAQYQMLKHWADSGTRGGSVTLSWQQLKQLLDILREMGLGGCAESLEMDYGLEEA